MERCPSCGAPLGAAADAPPGEAGRPGAPVRVLHPEGGGATILELPLKRRPAGLRPLVAGPPNVVAPPEPSGRFALRTGAVSRLMRDLATGAVELSGLPDDDDAERVLAGHGLVRRVDGTWTGRLSAGAFAGLAADWATLLAREAVPAPSPLHRAPWARPSVLSWAAPPSLGHHELAPSCAICGEVPVRGIGDAGLLAASYPDLVCPSCDARARNGAGGPPAFNPTTGTGDNPVYIDGRRCWRLYRFGGWVTLHDRHGSRSLGEFIDRLTR